MTNINLCLHRLGLSKRPLLGMVACLQVNNGSRDVLSYSYQLLFFQETWLNLTTVVCWMDYVTQLGCLRAWLELCQMMKYRRDVNMDEISSIISCLCYDNWEQCCWKQYVDICPPGNVATYTKMWEENSVRSMAIELPRNAWHVWIVLITWLDDECLDQVSAVSRSH